MRRLTVAILVLCSLLTGCRKKPEAGSHAAPPQRVAADVHLQVLPETATGAPPQDVPQRHDSTDSIDLQPETINQRTPSWVQIISPAHEEVVPNPVAFRFLTGGEVAAVALFVDEMPLRERPFPPTGTPYIHDFKGVNVLRHLTIEAYNAAGKLVASDSSSFLPSGGYIPLPPGFNAYVIQAINDVWRYPRNGTAPYCWRKCPGTMGMLHDAWYMGEKLWEGTGTCFCTGHTLEIFLDAVRRWRAASGVDEKETFGGLTMKSLHGGSFYQFWQGYGISNEASSADALESADIGYNIYPDSWETALPGDFVNLSREDGTGHAIIFHSWLRERDRIVGLRYYGCNRRGSADPVEEPEDRTGHRSGPSFVSARFIDDGGKVLPQFLFIGHVIDPLLGY
jgi:hypothetical protein